MGSDGDVENDDDLPYSISATSDSARQKIQVNRIAPLMLSAILINQDGSDAPIADVPVVFVVDKAQDDKTPRLFSIQSGTWVSSTTVSTSSEGIASVLVIAGTDSGDFTIEARQVDAINSPASFVLEVEAGDSTSLVGLLVKKQGDQQTAFLNEEAFPNLLVVQALDVSGTPVVNAQVSFDVSGATGSVISPSALTDASGLTPMMQVVVGNQPGVFNVIAQANGKQVTFDLALAPDESQFQFGTAGNTVAVQQTIPPTFQDLSIWLRDASGTGWPYINVDSMTTGSDLLFSDGTPSGIATGPYFTDPTGGIPLPQIEARELVNGFLSVWVDRATAISKTFDVQVYAPPSPGNSDSDD
jgi:hypothetical protein